MLRFQGVVLGLDFLVQGVGVQEPSIRAGSTPWAAAHMSHSLNSLKGGSIGDYIGDY